MNRVQLALFPAILLGILAIVFFASLTSTSETVQASNSLIDPTPLTKTAPTLAPATATASSQTVQVTGACTLPTRYPESIRQWCGWIIQYATQSNLDPRLIAAVMLQESGGNPQAYSKSGAVGLMQVMPRDGLAASFQCNGRPCFASRPTMDELFNPEYNIAYGVRMLAGLVQKKGNIRDALRAYGPMDVGYYYADKVLAIYQN